MTPAEIAALPADMARCFARLFELFAAINPRATDALAQRRTMEHLLECDTLIELLAERAQEENMQQTMALPLSLARRQVRFMLASAQRRWGAAA